MSDLIKEIEALAAPYIDEINGFIVDSQILESKKGKIITLFIDTDTGITVDQCAEVSRKLMSAMEQINLIKEQYILQISSPGLDRPLKLIRQYRKNIGRMFHVRFNDNGEIREISAKLISVENDILKFVAQEKIYNIKFDSVIESIEELPW